MSLTGKDGTGFRWVQNWKEHRFFAKTKSNNCSQEERKVSEVIIKKIFYSSQDFSNST